MNTQKLSRLLFSSPKTTSLVADPPNGHPSRFFSEHSHIFSDCFSALNITIEASIAEAAANFSNLACDISFACASPGTLSMKKERLFKKNCFGTPATLFDGDLGLGPIFHWLTGFKRYNTAVGHVDWSYMLLCSFPESASSA